MSVLHREIHPEATVLDDRQGIVEYVASDESIDADSEIVRADGWRFDRMQKNAPFVDSHRSGTIASQLGKVIDFRVAGGQLVETVQWAIDVAENEMARFGYAMTKAGYNKAVSVGFLPSRLVTRLPAEEWPGSWQGAQIADANRREGRKVWEQQRAEVRLDLSIVRTIYIQQQQTELSACIIGANPNALAKSYKAGILTDSMVNKISAGFPDFAAKVERAVHQGRLTYSFPTKQPEPNEQMEKQNMTANFLQKFSQLTGATKGAFGRVESARRTGSDGEMELAVRVALKSLERERRLAETDPIQAALADPETAFYWDTMARYLGGASHLNTDQSKFVDEMKDLRASICKGLDTTSTLIGFPIPVSTDVFNLLLVYGAFRALGVRPMPGNKTKFAKVTSLPDAVFITPTATGVNRVIPADASLAGSSITQQCNLLAALVEISEEVANDEKVDLGSVLLEMFVQGLAARLDFACFSGDGSDDQDSGLQTGIFIDGTIASVAANAGNTMLAQLERGDFLSVVGAVAPAALQRPCRWFINPALIPTLMTLKDGPKYLLKTPAETQGEWHLVGFPVTWAAAAPSAVTPGSKVAAFGEPNSYLIGIREDFEIATSNAAKFAQNLRQIRAISRARADLREATGLATLKLAAQ